MSDERFSVGGSIPELASLDQILSGAHDRLAFLCRSLQGGSPMMDSGDERALEGLAGFLADIAVLLHDTRHSLPFDVLSYEPAEDTEETLLAKLQARQAQKRSTAGGGR